MATEFVRRSGLRLAAVLCLIALGELIQPPVRLDTLLGMLLLYAVIGGVVISLGAVGYRAVAEIFGGRDGRE